MHTLYALSVLSKSAAVRNALARLRREAAALLGALLSPNKLIAEVEAMRVLQAEADRIEGSQPARAAVLRTQASLVGLR